MKSENIILNVTDDVNLLCSCLIAIQSALNSGESDNESIAQLIDVVLYYIRNEMSYLNGENENE